MTTDEILFTKLKIPKGYKEIITSLRQSLINSNYQTLVTNFSQAKTNLKLFDLPSIISNAHINTESFLINQTTLYSQGLYFGETAKTAPIDVKPLLYHYAENSLFAFFVYSLNSYTPQHAISHGLRITKWDQDVEKIQIQLSTNGFFPRIIDTYSLCRVDTPFSFLQFDPPTNGFKEINSTYSIINQPSLTLNDLILLRDQLGTQLDSYLYDIIDFLLLFFASSLARYRPHLWVELLRGEKDTHYAWFNQCFERFDLFKFRLLKSLIDIHKTGSMVGCQLHKIDVATKQEMNR